MIAHITATLVAAIVLGAGVGRTAEPAKESLPLKLRLLPAAAAGEPWLAYTEKNAGEILKGLPAGSLSVTVNGLRPGGSKNAAAAVYLNRVAIRAGDEYSDRLDGYLGKSTFYPAEADSHSFLLPAGETFAKLSKAGKIRLDRPLIFAVVLTSLDTESKLEEADWSIESVTLTIK